MRFELRLFAIAALLIVVIAASCARQSIAEVRRGVMPWERTEAGTQTSPATAPVPGRSTMRPVLGGLGNIDEIGFRTKGWSGVTLRFLDPKNAKRTCETNWVMDLLRVR
jgi:hypothetical protein